MNLRRFVWRNAFRNKRRTGLTILSIGFSLFLLMVMLTVRDRLLNPVTHEEAAFRLLTSRSTSLADMMPMAYLDKIRRLPNVEHVAPFQWFNGIYRDPDYIFPTMATDPKLIWDIYTEQKISPDQKAAFIAERVGAVAGEDLVQRFGWKVGDRITLIGTIFPVDLDLKIVGTFKSKQAQNLLYFQFDYLNEAMGNFDKVGAFVIKATNPEFVSAISQSIDGMFRNSPAATRTDTEKAFVLGFMAMLGNVQAILGSVGGVVVFTMLLVAASMMAMAVRERIREVAILKTIGYSRRMVVWLVIAEAMFISLTGAALGIAIGETLRWADMDKITQGFIPRFAPGPITYAGVLGAGIVIGLISGFFPAWRAANMTITGAMRRQD